MKPTNYSPETLEYQIAPDYMDYFSYTELAEFLIWDAQRRQKRDRMMTAICRAGLVIGILLGVFLVVAINRL